MFVACGNRVLYRLFVSQTKASDRFNAVEPRSALGRCKWGEISGKGSQKGFLFCVCVLSYRHLLYRLFSPSFVLRVFFFKVRHKCVGEERDEEQDPQGRPLGTAGDRVHGFGLDPRGGTSKGQLRDGRCGKREAAAHRGHWRDGCQRGGTTRFSFAE